MPNVAALANPADVLKSFDKVTKAIVAELQQLPAHDYVQLFVECNNLNGGFVVPFRPV